MWFCGRGLVDLMACGRYGVFLWGVLMTLNFGVLIGVGFAVEIDNDSCNL